MLRIVSKNEKDTFDFEKVEGVLHVFLTRELPVNEAHKGEKKKSDS